MTIINYMTITNRLPRALRRLDVRTAARLAAIRSRARGLACPEHATQVIARETMAQLVKLAEGARS